MHPSPTMFDLPPQTFSPGDFGAIGFLIVLEALLSADNALVIALLVKHLPRDQQRRALFIGLIMAFVYRGLAIIFASSIMSLWWLQVLGGVYLLFLPIKHFLTHHKDAESAKTGETRSFLKTVIMVEFTDIVFALDSVLAAVAAVNGKDKLWVVYAGAMSGVIALRFAARIFAGVLSKYPDLSHMAYLLVGWVGIKLMILAGHSYEGASKINPGLAHLPFHIPEMSPVVFWSVMALIMGGGVWYAVKHPSAGSEDHDPAIEAVEGDILEPAPQASKTHGKDP